ncbi:unnamed protein product [Brassica oleracea var. botrytis]
MIVFAFVRIKNIDNGHGEAEGLVKCAVAVHHRDELDVQGNQLKRLLEICLIHILDASANQFHKLKHLNLCCYAEHDK